MNLTIPAVILAFAALACSFSTDPKASNSSTDKRETEAAAKKTPSKDDVKSEIVGLTNDIWDALQKGNRDFIDEVTTDDFRSTDIEGTVQNKRQVLADVKREGSIRSWAIAEPELSSYDETSGVLTYRLDVRGRNGVSVKVRVTDTYVKKDGKWYIKNHQQTLVK